MPQQSFTKSLILCSFFAALTGVLSIVSIPLPFSPVPVNLALLSVYLAGGLLGPKNGSISLVVYVLLGAIGLPVFHNLTGGLSILLGPTGGFIIGYIAAAFLVGLFHKKSLLSSPTKGLIIGMLTGLTACYSRYIMVHVHIRSRSAIRSAPLRSPVSARGRI